MDQEIRTVQVDEFDEWIRFLDLCFGASKGWFVRNMAHVYQPQPETCAYGYVIEQEGRIVSHVGVYPLETVAAGVTLRIGGIGAVATLPAERGHGHMSRLLRHAIEMMRQQGYVASWLGGDRQRYNSFGWERANPGYNLTFSRRSLDRAKIEPARIEEQYLCDMGDAVARFGNVPPCYAIRPHLSLQLRREGLRAWTAYHPENNSVSGYAIADPNEHGPMQVIELVSATGHEAAFLRAIMDRADCSELRWCLSAWDQERLARVMPCTSGHKSEGWWMYRVIDLQKLLTAARPHLAQRAAALRSTSVAISIREHDRTDTATIEIQNGQVEVRPGLHARSCIELDAVEAARLLFGGPPVSVPLPPELTVLLPVPAWVPPLDYV